MKTQVVTDSVSQKTLRIARWTHGLRLVAVALGTILLAPDASADCWGSVSYLVKRSDGSIEAGLNPRAGYSCNCTNKASGSIGNGSLVYVFPNAENTREIYASLLAALTSKTQVYLGSANNCSGKEVVSYAQ